MYEKILLIYPYYPFQRSLIQFFTSPPVNLISIASAVDSKVDILDLRVDKLSIDELKKKMIKYQLIGVSCLTATVRQSLNICKIAKKLGLDTIIGGIHPTLEPELIDEYKFIDMLVRGEGEIPFRELLIGKNKSSIAGLSYREGNKVIHNMDQQFGIIDKLPYLKSDLVSAEKYGLASIKIWSLETSRGCPFACKFCCVSKIYNRSYRTKTPERVIRELYKAPDGTKFVAFLDDNFTLNRKRVMRICDLISRSRLNFMYFCQSRVDDIARNPDMVKAMAKVGFKLIFLGIETFKQESLDLMDKKISVENVKRAIEICHQNKIRVIGAIIIGNIGDKKEDVIRTVKIIKQLKIDILSTSPLHPYPGTEIHREAVENGWMPRNYDWTKWKLQPIMRTPDLSIKEIKGLNDYANNSFYTLNNIGRLILNFSKYVNVFALMKKYLRFQEH